MRNPKDIKPELEIKLRNVGGNLALILPRWFTRQWEIKDKKTYRINISELNSVQRFLSFDLFFMMNNSFIKGVEQ